MIQLERTGSSWTRNDVTKRNTRIGAEHQVHVLAAFLVLTTGCTGQIASAAGSGPGQTAAGPGPGMSGISSTPDGRAPETADGAATAGKMPLRRLSRDEYNRTVRDLLGDTTNPGNALPQDALGASGFTSPGIVGALEASTYQDMAEQVAARALSSRGLAALLGCEPNAAMEDACISQFVTSFGRRAYRRKLAQEEVDRYVGVYHAARTTLNKDAPAAVGMLVRAFLQSAFFLYHWELGLRPPSLEAGVVKLDPDSVAARLSYFLWGTMPDAALFAAVDRGALSTAADVKREAARLLADPQAREGVGAFYVQSFGLQNVENLQKDTKRYPEFTAALARDMQEETKTFVSEVILAGDGKLRTLLTAPFSFVNANLAALYGLAPPAGSGFVRVELDPTQRSGLLTQASLLSVHALPYETSPVRRGKMVREHLLCASVPPPPPDVNTNLTAVDDRAPMREQFAAHSVNPTCAGCHSAMDPIGFGFENYDGIGRFRSVEAEKPVDAAGSINGLAGGDKPFADFHQMVSLLAESEDVRRCVSSQWLRFAYGRAEGSGDESSTKAAYEAFAGSDFNVRELMLALAESRSFLYRTMPEGEVLQ